MKRSWLFGWPVGTVCTVCTVCSGAGACLFDTSAPEDAKILCDNDQECPPGSGQICVGGHCALPAALVPTVEEVAFTVAEDTASEPIDVVARDGEGFVDESLLIAVGDGANGTVAFDETTRQVVYTPSPDFFGEDSFPVDVTDAAGAEVRALFFVTVTPVNDPPVPQLSPIVEVVEDVPALIAMQAVDVDGDQLTFRFVALTEHRGFEPVPFSASGFAVYAPLTNVVGGDLLQYEVSDDGTTWVPGEVVIEILPTPDPTVILTQTVIVDAVTPAQRVALLFRDPDEDITALAPAITVIEQPVNAIIAPGVDGTGEILVTPGLHATQARATFIMSFEGIGEGSDGIDGGPFQIGIALELVVLPPKSCAVARARLQAAGIAASEWGGVFVLGDVVGVAPPLNDGEGEPPGGGGAVIGDGDGGPILLEERVAFCEQQRAGGGWELVLKDDTRSTTLNASDILWSEEATLHPQNPEDDNVEAMLPGFNRARADDLMLRLSSREPGGPDNFVAMPIEVVDSASPSTPTAVPSLRGRTQAPLTVQSTISGADWLALAGAPSDVDCNAAFPLLHLGGVEVRVGASLDCSRGIAPNAYVLGAGLAGSPSASSGLAHDDGSTVLVEGRDASLFVRSRDFTGETALPSRASCAEHAANGASLTGWYVVDGATALCTFTEGAPPVCGDGIIQSPEECDDGNVADLDGCASSCKIAVCGNGRIEDGEECDDPIDTASACVGCQLP